MKFTLNHEAHINAHYTPILCGDLCASPAQLPANIDAIVNLLGLQASFSMQDIRLVSDLNEMAMSEGHKLVISHTKADGSSVKMIRKDYVASARYLLSKTRDLVGERVEKFNEGKAAIYADKNLSVAVVIYNSTEEDFVAMFGPLD